MNLVGELVLTRNQVLQYNAAQDDVVLHGIAHRLNLITAELQERVMKTRMQPVSRIFNLFPRVVRDLATALSKQITLEIEGAETELDRTLVEAIKDPLTHIVRNSCDHGIEAPEERLRQGKPAGGRLALRAFHEGGQVNIEIADDGAGIDPQRIRAKVVERGILSAEQVARLSDREAVNLVFLPGFSTAQAVTKVSGRGVGMDVVRTHIEGIGGTVELQSQPGQGTTLLIAFRSPWPSSPACW
jgi:two-component system chemotaxis sensor kinase CheA